MTRNPADDSAKPRLPLHQRIYAQLRREISATYKPGDILESQNQLAERFKVSFLTIREALSILVEEGVIERKQGRDTIVINPAGGQHVAVLLELDVADPRTSPFFRLATQRARSWFQEQGIPVRQYFGIAPPALNGLHLYNEQGTTCPELIEDVETGRIRGVFAIGGPSEKLADYLADLGIPVVGSTSHDKYRVVSASTLKLVRLGIEHLLSQGRRKLAFMTWGQPNAIIEVAREKGLDLNPNWLRYDLPPSAPGSGWEEFREIWTATRERPDGILITDDILFEDALHAMIESNVRVPEDLLVVTHANKGAEPWAPFPVTRLEVNPAEFAEAGGRLLLDVINKTATASVSIELDCTISIPPELVSQGESANSLSKGLASPPTDKPKGRARHRS